MIERIQKRIKYRGIPFLIKQLNNSSDIEDIRLYQDRMIASLISLICLLAGIANFVVRIIWKDQFYEIVLVTLAFWVLGFFIDYFAYNIKSIILRIHLMSLSIVILESMIVLAYYERIGTTVWTIAFLTILISMIRLDRIMFTFTSGGAVILNNIMYFKNLDTTVVLNELYFIVQIILFVLILVIGLIWTQTYKKRFYKSHDQFVEISEQKEELTQLYEEVLANQEKLRVQNQRLNDYNTEIKENEKKLNFMAYNDSLTGLPNRKNIIERLKFLMDLAKDNNTRFALVFMDADDFKKINDNMGHHIGDHYLKEISERLDDIIEAHDTVGRFGGDEFALVIQHITTDEALYEYIDRIRESVNENIYAHDMKIYSSASFGVAIFPDDADKISDLFKAADAAMYKAKSLGKNNIQFYEKEMKEEILDKITMEHELKQAYNNNEFYLVYQPQIALREGFNHGFEALLRWESPTRGVVGPADFIYLLEDTGLIIDVGYWVIEEACKKIIELNRLFDEKFYISVNISPKQLMKESFVGELLELIEKYKISKTQLDLEITENVLIEDSEMIIEKLNKIKTYGIRIALDDFGTGYASLNYLKILPIDVLKIDKEFIWGLDEGDYSKKVVSSIIDIVHDMDITVVAEGVENNGQLNYLVKEKCDHVQGFLISKPVKGEELNEFIKEQH